MSRKGGWHGPSTHKHAQRHAGREARSHVYLLNKNYVVSTQRCFTVMLCLPETTYLVNDPLHSILG